MKRKLIQRDRSEDDQPKDVHTEHCCLKHGCKYMEDMPEWYVDGDIGCSVVSGRKKQSFPCEVCGFDETERAARKPKYCPKCGHDVTDL